MANITRYDPFKDITRFDPFRNFDDPRSREPRARK